MKKYFNAHIILLIPIIILLALLPSLIFGPSSISGDFPKILTPFLSTFFGAGFAFYLNRKKDLTKEDDERISALRVALFTVARQQNVLAQVWKAQGEWKDRLDRSLNMQPISLPDSEHLRQDLQALSFIIPIDPVLLLELTVEDDRFAQTITSVQRHSDFHVSHVQPALDKSALYRRRASIAEIEQSLGRLIFGTAKANAQNIFEHLMPTRVSLAQIMPRIFDFAKTMYPNETFLRTDFIDDTEHTEKEEEHLAAQPPTYAVPLTGNLIRTRFIFRI